MFPASSNLTLEKAVDKLNKLEQTINEYVQLYESHKYKSPKTHVWLMQSKAWIDRIITAIKNKQSTIQGTNESVIAAFKTLENGYLEHTHQVQEINKGETPELNKLQQINREFLFVEPNLNKIIEIGFKTESEFKKETEDNLLRQGYRKISLNDMSLLGAHATVNYESIYGGRTTQEGRFERSINGNLMLVPPGKRKMGWALAEPAYAKIIRMPNSYEQKQLEKKQRYQELASANKEIAKKTFDNAINMQHAIPLGQPILYDHYSAKGDIAYRNRIDNTFHKAVKEEEKSDYYEHKSQSVGTAGISSDNPDAIALLKEKLDALEKQREHYREINNLVKHNQTASLTPHDIVDIKFHNAVRGGNTIPEYVFSNLSGNIKHIRDRIAQLEQLQARKPVVEEGNGYTYREDTELNRVMFIFTTIPSEDIRGSLKKHGFRWSPTNRAWQRQLNGAGIYAANVVKREINPPNTREVRTMDTLNELRRIENERREIQNQPDLSSEQIMALANQIYEIIQRVYTARHEGISDLELEGDMLGRGVSYANTRSAIEWLFKIKKIIPHEGKLIPYNQQNEYKPIFRGNQGVLF